MAPARKKKKKAKAARSTATVRKKPAPSDTQPALSELRSFLRSVARPELVPKSKQFFQTHPGGYGHGDRFLGIRVPDQRVAAKKFRGLSITDCDKLLRSEYHEERLVALFLLADAYARGSEQARQAIYDLYLKRTDRINNWDLVDSSAPHIVGEHVWSGSAQEKVLYELVVARSVWERRIAMLATFVHIRKESYQLPLAIAERLIDDKHDLIHKAVGWMLREIGERSQATEEHFLLKHYRTMPRTMLRYAIEKFPEAHRQAYLKGKA